MLEITKQLLIRRGIDTPEAQEEFLSPRPKTHYDPLLLKGMAEGVDLILAHVEKGSQITIYGDYDADGVTSTVILRTVLLALGAKVDYYIPSRFDEGYGLNGEALDKLHARGTSLIVTVDCGCTAVEEVAHAKELGMDIIVTDHHNCGDELPDTLLINPKQPGCPYPFKGLAGCGVAYKLALALRDAAGLDPKVTTEVLDMVAIGTVADIVPLVDENRSLVKYGLSKINERKRPGLRVLLEKIGMGTRIIGAQDISFGIGPNINAAGRMAAATLGVELFTAEEESVASAKAAQMVMCNTARRVAQDDILKQCLELKETFIDPDLFPFIAAPGAHEGITGIVAGKLREMFDKPIAILTPGLDGTCKGTARSVDRVDLHALLSQCDYLFEKFGGHKGACGFTIKEEDVPTLRQEINGYMRVMLSQDPHLLEPLRLYDMAIDAKDASLDLAEELQLLAPFGAENPEPAFLFSGLTLSDMRFMGNEGKHARLLLADQNGYRINGVRFSLTDAAKAELAVGSAYDVIGQLGINTWQNQTSVQLIVRRMTPHV